MPGRLLHNDPRPPTEWECLWKLPPSDSFFKVPLWIHHVEGNIYEYQIGFAAPAALEQACQVKVEGSDEWSGLSNIITVPEPGAGALVVGALLLAALVRRKGRGCDR